MTNPVNAGADLQPCRSPYCECEVGKCTHPGFYDARTPMADIEKELAEKCGYKFNNGFVERLWNGEWDNIPPIEASEAFGAVWAALLAEAGERAKLEAERDALKRRHEGRMFRLQDGPAIPWEIIAPHARQCERNHSGQTLERIQERGGLGVAEFWYVMHDAEWPHGMEKFVSRQDALAYAHDLVNIFTKQREQIADAELRASTEAARARGLEAQLALARPYVANWMQANEDGWIEKKAATLKSIDAALKTTP